MKICRSLIGGIALFMMATAGAGPVETPGKGSPLRTAILDGLRKTEPLRKLSQEWHAKIVFTDVTIRRIGDWAWVSASPISEDNKNHFESVSGVMRQSKGEWQMVEFVSDEIAAADDPQQEFRKWQMQFAKKHQCPDAIFPVNF
jgi:SnoaL-like protein